MTRVVVHIGRLAIRGFGAHEGHALGRELRHRLAADIAAELSPGTARTLHHEVPDQGGRIGIRSAANGRSICLATGRVIANKVAR